MPGLSLESVIALLAAIGAGSFLPTLLKLLFSSGTRRSAALLERERRVVEWEEGFRDELRKDAEDCREANRLLVAQVSQLQSTIAELKQKVDSLETHIAQLQQGAHPPPYTPRPTRNGNNE